MLHPWSRCGYCGELVRCEALGSSLYLEEHPDERRGNEGSMCRGGGKQANAETNVWRG